MPIRFKCPHCQKTLSVKDHLAGKKAACPACKKALVIPSPARAPVQAPAPAEPPEDVEAAAAAALTDEPKPPPQDETPQTIDFTCPFCDEEVHMPLASAGKQEQCPNAECRRIIKVPLPKEDKPKDWRKLDVKGPSAALINQQEKIDEAAWGTQTDKGRASTKSLVEAGAVEAPPPRTRVTARDWVRRGLYAIGAVGAAAVLLVVLSRLHNDRAVDKEARNLLEEFKQHEKDLKDPLLIAEGHRGVGILLMRGGVKPSRVQQQFATARGVVPPAGKSVSINQELFWIDLALAQVELGGSEEQAIALEKVDWRGSNGMQKELERTLEQIQSPEVRAWAVRELASQLLTKASAKEQANVAVGLATSTANLEPGRRSPAQAQLVALLFALEKQDKAEAILKAPDAAAKGGPGRSARVAYAEGQARKGDYQAALALAAAKGPARDRLEALAGIASIARSQGKKDEAADAVKRALEIAQPLAAKDLPSWTLLQLVRNGAHVGLSEELKALTAKLPSTQKELQERCLLELFLAQCALSATPVSNDEMIPLSAVAGQQTLALAWEALSRQYARTGGGSVMPYVEADSHRKDSFRPLVLLGAALGGR